MAGGENGVSFGCLGNSCPNHCCAAFDGVSTRLTSLSNVKFTEIILTDDDARAIIALGRDDLILDKGAGSIPRIKTAEDGTCYALKGGRCEIYSARPSICRAYPLYLDLFAGLCYVNDCQAFERFARKSIGELRGEMFSLLDAYQFWIDHYREELGHIRESDSK